MDIYIPPEFGKDESKILDKFPRTKRMPLRKRLAALFCRAHGYQHGPWIVKRIAKLIKKRYWSWIFKDGDVRIDR